MRRKGEVGHVYDTQDGDKKTLEPVQVYSGAGTKRVLTGYTPIPQRKAAPAEWTVRAI